MINEINAERTPVENQRNYDVTSGVAPAGIPHVMSLTKDYSYVAMISGRERTWEQTIIFYHNDSILKYKPWKVKNFFH